MGLGVEIKIKRATSVLQTKKDLSNLTLNNQQEVVQVGQC